MVDIQPALQKQWVKPSVICTENDGLYCVLLTTAELVIFWSRQIWFERKALSFLEDVMLLFIDRIPPSFT